MVKQFTRNTLRELTDEINRLDILKENILQVFCTNNEQMMWVCLYYTKQ